MAVIRITQYLSPNGKRAEIPVDIPDELKEIAEGLEISCEAIPPAQCIIYAHRKGEGDEDDRSEIGTNGSTINNPTMALERLIRRFEKKQFKPFLED